MAKVIIENTDDNKVIVTFDNGIIYPICEVTDGNFKISEITNINILTLISNLINQVGSSLRFQLRTQGFTHKTLNDLADGK